MFINKLAEEIEKDPAVRDKLKVVYLEDYRVSLAELLIPGADISEQISLAGTEASGTGNMKLMMNGAITLGTMDGANVEIYEAVGAENIIIFGMNTKEVNELKRDGYVPMNYYNNNAEIHNLIEFINKGIGGKMFGEISNTAIYHDPYMALADFGDYVRAQNAVSETYKDAEKFTKMSLTNIAKAGIFSSDRAITEYAKNIWYMK